MAFHNTLCSLSLRATAPSAFRPAAAAAVSRMYMQSARRPLVQQRFEPRRAKVPALTQGDPRGQWSPAQPDDWPADDPTPGLSLRSTYAVGLQRAPMPVTTNKKQDRRRNTRLHANVCDPEQNKRINRQQARQRGIKSRMAAGSKKTDCDM